MAWNMYKTVAGFNTYENFEVKPDDAYLVSKFIKSKFEKRVKCASGLWNIITDDVYNEIEVDGIRITIGWDNWSRLFIMAWDDNGNKIIEEIAVLIKEEDLLPN